MVYARRKLYIYMTALALILNLVYQRQIFIEQWMRYQLRNETIVITFSTTPHRIDKMQDTFKTILNQNIKLSGIYLSIPYVFKRDNIEYVIPRWLQETPNITLLRTEDYGPGTKILGLLKQIQLPHDAIIITVDDDITYPKNLALQLAYKAFKTKTYAVGILGAYPEYDDNGIIGNTTQVGLIKTIERDAIVSILQGYGGVAYRRSFFDDGIFNLVKDAPQECVNSDDIYLSFYLAKQNITRQVLENNFIGARNIKWHTEIGLDQNALHQLHPTPTEKHRVCVAYLKSYSPTTVF